MEQLTINVTQSDINKAGSGAYNCPIAQAIKRMFETNKVSAGYNTIRIGDKYYSNSTAGRIFMRDFDNNLTVYPCEIKIQQRNIESAH